MSSKKQPNKWLIFLVGGGVVLLAGSFIFAQSYMSYGAQTTFTAADRWHASLADAILYLVAVAGGYLFWRALRHFAHKLKTPIMRILATALTLDVLIGLLLAIQPFLQDALQVPCYAEFSSAPEACAASLGSTLFGFLYLQGVVFPITTAVAWVIWNYARSFPSAKRTLQS